jgi:hypothetical protein
MDTAFLVDCFTNVVRREQWLSTVFRRFRLMPLLKSTYPWHVGRSCSNIQDNRTSLWNFVRIFALFGSVGACSWDVTHANHPMLWFFVRLCRVRRWQVIHLAWLRIVSQNAGRSKKKTVMIVRFFFRCGRVHGFRDRSTASPLSFRCSLGFLYQSIRGHLEWDMVVGCTGACHRVRILLQDQTTWHYAGCSRRCLERRCVWWKIWWISNLSLSSSWSLNPCDSSI